MKNMIIRKINLNDGCAEIYKVVEIATYKHIALLSKVNICWIFQAYSR